MRPAFPFVDMSVSKIDPCGSLPGNPVDKPPPVAEFESSLGHHPPERGTTPGVIMFHPLCNANIMCLLRHTVIWLVISERG